ncbi:MAG TPA: hypothetical protein VM052_06525 [Candidatus Limnocylindrales bacterium]|nr:hypothetical protein [Candidatus Limnocylindrales bacterium]
MSVERADVLAEVAERVALRNEFRGDTFQDEVARMVSDAREHWRNEKRELPPRGSDTTFDALLGLAEESDASPMAVRDACAYAMRVAEEAKVSA